MVELAYHYHFKLNEVELFFFVLVTFYSMFVFRAHIYFQLMIILLVVCFERGFFWLKWPKMKWFFENLSIKNYMYIPSKTLLQTMHTHFQLLFVSNFTQFNVWVEGTSLITCYISRIMHKSFFSPKLWTILVSIWWWTLFKWYACILLKNICLCPGYAYQLSYRNCKRINSKILIMQHTAANKQPTNTIQAITFAKRFVHFTHLFSWNIICIRQNKPICHRNTYGFDG